MKSSKRNWTQYNRSLVNRGRITLWISEEAISSWHAARTPRKKGRPFTFSDSAIIAALTIRFVFRLSLRATEGMINSLLEMLDLPMKAPGYTAICKRMKSLEIPARLKKGAVRTLVLDSSGLKVFGEGEWKVKKHGAGKRRQWKKIHIAMDARTQEIVFSEVTDANRGDTIFFNDWVKGRSLRAVLMDGAADTSKCYQHADKVGVELITPPQKNAVLREEPWMEKRNTAIKQILGLGGDKIAREIWGLATGYSRRALVEGVFSRWKRILGSNFSSRTGERQRCECYIKSLILNKMRMILVPVR